MVDLVSIIIPVYNSEKYIGKCLDSVLKQTYQNIEIIVVNDGSKDNSLEILKKYERENLNKITVVDQENKGVAITRNESILKANGKYIMFIDNDDYIDKDYVETYVREAEIGNFDVVIGGYSREDENGKTLKLLKLENTEWSKLMVMAPWAKIYRKQYFLDNNITFLNNNIGEDVYFNLKATLLTDKVKIIDYTGYTWFFNNKSLSNSKQKNIKDLQVYELLNSCYDMVKDCGILDSKTEMVETYFIKYAVWILSFSTKKLPYKAISEEYDKLFKWIEERFPNYKKCKNISFTRPAGEIASVRIMTAVFMLCHKLHLGKIFTYLYSRI